ncbi:hypothetical protein GKAS_00947 [Kluyvera ascorbata ATCC 33433]|nr:hypothetical protein GKAS_00947 [Kluyvera ascorbata ATCC 33433]
MQNMGTGHIGPSGKIWKRTIANKTVTTAGLYININDLNIRPINLLMIFIMDI